MIKYLCVLFFLFTLNTFSFTKNITIDGNDSDWTVITDTFSLMPDNSPIIIDNEWVWKDKIGDVRTNSNYTPDMSDSADLTEFRITASTSSLFFLIKFKKMNLSANNYIYPHIQIALDRQDLIPKHHTIFGNSSNGYWDSYISISEKAEWTSLLEIYQLAPSSDTIVKNTNIWLLNSSGSSYHEDQFYTKMAVLRGATSNFIEVEVSSSALGWAYGFSDTNTTKLNFSVAVNYASMPFGIITSSEYPREFETGTSNIVDCVSMTSGTLVEISDGTLDYYSEIWIASNGNIVTDNTLPEFLGNKIYVNNEEVESADKSQVYYSPSVKPKFIWVYQDAGQEEEAGIQIQLGDDDNWNAATDTDGMDGGPAEMWDYGFTCSTDTSDRNSPLFSPLTYSGKDLIPGSTYYLRARLLNTRSTSSNWLSKSFTIVKSSVILNLGTDDMVIDWNNPFYPGKTDGTGTAKIRYTVAEDKFVELCVYNLKGERVRTLDMGNKIGYAKVPIAIEWDGKDDNGGYLGTGLYLVHLKLTDQLKKTAGITKKIFIIR